MPRQTGLIFIWTATVAALPFLDESACVCQIWSRSDHRRRRVYAWKDARTHACTHACTHTHLQKLYHFIQKKGDTSSIENYRPISLLSSFSKVIEQIIFNQLFNFFQCNNLFYNSQCEFRQNHSTEFAALELIDIINIELYAEHDPFAVILDMSKAFDTIDHTILLKNYLITAFNINY